MKMPKAKKEYDCHFLCGYPISKGQEYTGWMEAEEEDDFIASKTYAFRIHDECYELFLALDGDPYEVSEDDLYENFAEWFYGTQEEYEALLNKYQNDKESRYYDYSWVIRAIDDGVRPKFEVTTWRNQERVDRMNAAFDKWMAWRKTLEVPST